MNANTFSIVGRGADGTFGGAVSSRVLAVGSRCLFVRAETAAVASQAYIHPYLGEDTLERMAGGASAEEAVAAGLAADDGREWRQVIAIGAEGPPAGHTGEETDPWHGHLLGTDCAAAGNLLVGEPTIAAMVETFEASPELPLPERLVKALAAGQAAGGDRRGKQSAAVRVLADASAPWVDLRVDDHEDPVAELGRLYELALPDLDRARRIASTREPIPVEDLILRREQVRQALTEQGR